MEIHELNTKAVTNPGYMVLDDGTDTYKANFGEINDTITTLGTDLSTAEGNITSLQTTVGSHTSSINTNATNIATLQKGSVYVTPEHFGAVGDGTTDDTQAFVDMLASGNSLFWLAAKTYYISSDLSVDVSNIQIRGCGKGKSIIKMASGVSVTFDTYNIDVYDVGFLNGDGVVTNSYKINFISCSFSGSDVGITMNSGYMNHVLNCSIMSNNIGIVLNDESYETIIQNNIIDQNKGVGVYICGTASGAVIKNNTIEGNQNTDGNGFGIITNCNYLSIVIDSNWFELNGTASSTLSADILTLGYYYSSDVSSVITLAQSLVPAYTSQYCNRGEITISNNNYTRTKYGIVCTGEGTIYNIFGNGFRGVSGLGNQPITIASRYYQSNTYYVWANTTYNPADTSIDSEMNSGINDTYIFTSLTYTYAVFDYVRKAIVFNGEYLINEATLEYTANTDYITVADGETYFKRVGDVIYFRITAKVTTIPSANTTIITLPTNVDDADFVMNYSSTSQMLFYWYNKSMKLRYSASSTTGGWLRAYGTLYVKS